MSKTFAVCVQIRNKSITVPTLHTLLNLSGRCFTSGYIAHIHFVDSLSSIGKLLKTHDKLLWIEYGYSLDIESFDSLFSDSFEALVYPSVQENVNWNSFKKRLDTSEPLHQKALEFDTTVETKLQEGFWSIQKTSPSIFRLECKSVEKKLKTRKGEGIKIPDNTAELFERFKDCGIKCVAYTKANVIVNKHYECVGNIMEAASVRCVKN